MAGFTWLKLTIFLAIFTVLIQAKVENPRRILDDSSSDVDKCGGCPCNNPCYPPPSPPPPSPCPPPPSPPPPPPPKKKPPSNYCPPPPGGDWYPPSPPYIIINGPPGSIYPIDPSWSGSARTLSTGLSILLIIIGLIVLW